ncbi:MAG: hypothetical protein J2P58_14640, partial [Acidimicrobiaceae bacterium]|nr:hypothetical protein [Acidimicrobiaceae bacterium]
ERAGHRGGRPAPLDLELHARLLPLVAGLVNDRVVGGIHDVSEGGFAVALAEMAIASGVGCRVSPPLGASDGVPLHRALFGEGPSLVLVSVDTSRFADLQQRCIDADLPLSDLGTAGGERVVIEGALDLPLADLAAAARQVFEVLR